MLELDRLGVRTVFPMHAALRDGVGEIVGAVMLEKKMTETRMTFEETTLVSLVTHQVGISLMNGMLHKEQVTAQLLEEEIATARKIQRNLLPENPPDLEGWELCASNRPSRDVGGDYHDLLPLPGGHLGIAIGDVSGKGIPAALLMSNLQAVLRVQVLAGLPADRLVAEVNRHIFRTTGSESFISFFLGELEPSLGTFTYTNAGHNAPLVVRECGDVETLDIGGLLLGGISRRVVSARLDQAEPRRSHRVLYGWSDRGHQPCRGYVFGREVGGGIASSSRLVCPGDSRQCFGVCARVPMRALARR